MVSRFFLKLLAKVVRRPVMRHLAAFEAATHQPRETQEALLRRILALQAETDFGRDHGFGSIQTVEDFRRRLPISPYEYFEPYIARVRRGELRALLADPCVHMFALTSGTTAARKFIPVTPQYLADYRRGWNIWGMRLFRYDHPEMKLRPIVQISSDWDEFRTEAGIPCGSVTGLTAQMQPRIIRWLYCLPGCTARIKDTAAKYYVALRLSLPRPVGMLVSANPSTIINFARAGDQQKDSLIRDIHDGTLSTGIDLAPEIRTELTRRLRKHPARARELEEIVRRTGTLYPRDYWPRNFILGNWTGGSVGAYLRHFPRYFADTPVRDVGLIASEGRMTIPMADGTPSGVLDVTSHYFEFIPESEIDQPRPIALAAHEVKEGEQYYIVPTTAFGLYRYHIHDLVRVTGFYHQTPLVEFLSKGAHFANVTGEKLSEYHVTQAMADVLRALDLSLTSYSLAPCWDEETPYYGLFIERGDLMNAHQGQSLARMLDQRLQEKNVEYASKRSSQRLGAVRLELLPDGAWQKWDQQRLARTGGSPEQYKHPCLIPDPAFRQSMPVEEEVRPIEETTTFATPPEISADL
jgi:GH3 auxin-responsive promoter